MRCLGNDDDDDATGAECFLSSVHSVHRCGLLQYNSNRVVAGLLRTSCWMNVDGDSCSICRESCCNVLDGMEIRDCVTSGDNRRVLMDNVFNNEMLCGNALNVLQYTNRPEG